MNNIDVNNNIQQIYLSDRQKNYPPAQSERIHRIDRLYIHLVTNEMQFSGEMLPTVLNMEAMETLLYLNDRKISC